MPINALSCSVYTAGLPHGCLWAYGPMGLALLRILTVALGRRQTWSMQDSSSSQDNSSQHTTTTDLVQAIHTCWSSAYCRTRMTCPTCLSGHWLPMDRMSGLSSRARTLDARHTTIYSLQSLTVTSPHSACHTIDVATFFSRPC